MNIMIYKKALKLMAESMNCNVAKCKIKHCTAIRNSEQCINNFINQAEKDI